MLNHSSHVEQGLMRDMRLSLSPPAYFALFAVSGFAGLMYESVWTHYLKLFLGHAAYAQTLVLAIFMSGMTIGAWLAGRFSHRLRNLLVGYAAVEAVVGVMALVFHPAFVGATGYTLDHVLPGVGSQDGAHALKWVLGALFIFPQSVLLGMTFPLMSGGVIRRFPSTPGHTLASLYFSNSIGAALGVLASGFLLIGLVGLPGTMLTAGLLNLLLSVLVWLVAKDGEPAPSLQQGGPARDWRSDRWVPFMLAVAAITGAASFLYEIAWIRMLSLVLGSSTHSFELMLAAFILGLALGGLYIRRRVDHIADPPRFLAWVQVIMGVLALMTLVIYSRAFDAMAFLMQALAPTDAGYDLFLVSSSVIALAVMLPATFMAGMTLPLATYVLMQRGHGERTIGAVYAANTAGCIVGILLAVHVFMVLGGVKGVVVAGGALDLALGVVLLAVSAPRLKRLELPGAAAAALAMIFVGIAAPLNREQMISGVYRHGKTRLGDGIEVLYYRDGKTASVALVGQPEQGMRISTNGKTDAMIAPLHKPASVDEATMVLAGALALAHHPRARSAANIGFGSGKTTHTLLATPQLERVDTVEIEPYMVEAARGFGASVRNAFSDPRSHLYYEDAKTFFSTRNARYDLIVSEPSNPWVSGISSLFTEEFYAHVRKHLAREGLLVQWLQGYETDMPLLASVFKALGAHFEDYVVYTTNGVDLLIVARAEGHVPALDPAVFRDPGLAKELGRVRVASVQDANFRRLAGRRVMESLIAAYLVPANSDYFPFLDQHAARARFLKKSPLTELTRLQTHPLPMLELLGARPGPQPRQPATWDGLYMPAVEAHEAAMFSTALRQGGPVPAGLARNWDYATLRLERCNPQDDWSGWRSAVRAIADRTIPYLAAEDAADIMQRLRDSPCVAKLPRVNAQWLDLLVAIARRDTERMGPLAAQLMDQDHEARGYLVQASMLAALSRNDAHAALQLWQLHGDALQGAGAQMPLDFHLMLAVAQRSLPADLRVSSVLPAR
jgi:predicted membrane-bound spermidine synthase